MEECTSIIFHHFYAVEIYVGCVLRRAMSPIKKPCLSTPFSSFVWLIDFHFPFSCCRLSRLLLFVCTRRGKSQSSGMQIAWMVLSRPLEANHRRGCKIVTNLRHLWGRMSDVDDNPFFRVFMHEYLWIRKLHREKKRSSVKKLHSSSDCWMAKKASTMHAEKLIKLSSFHPPTSIPQSRTIQLFIICMLAFHKHALPITVLANNREEKFIWKSFALARRVKEVEAEFAGKKWNRE